MVKPDYSLQLAGHVLINLVPCLNFYSGLQSCCPKILTLNFGPLTVRSRHVILLMSSSLASFSDRQNVSSRDWGEDEGKTSVNV